MRERLSGFWGSARERWSGTARRVRILLLGGIAVMLVAALAVVLILNHTDYIVLYNNLTVAENAEVLAQLQEMGVEGKLDGNALLIPADKENTVRMLLAVKGYPDSGFGYETYQLGSGLTATQSDKNYYETAQAQERLESMIRTFPEVRDVHVTIGRQESSGFVLQEDKTPTTVAVKIEKMPGRSLDAAQVQGIINTVLTSVPGVTEDNISIVDENGDMRLTLEMGGDIHTQKLRLTEQINEIFRRRILNLLNPVYGEGKVEVRVNSVLDTAETTIDKTEFTPFDPDDPTNNPIDYRENEYERNLNGEIVQGVPGANDNTDVPQYAAEILDDGQGSYYYSHNIIDYLVSSERSMITDAGMDITDMTVAVIIDADTLPVGERDVILDSVAMASGVQPDKISVQNLAFARLPDLETVVPRSIFSSLLFWICLALILLVLIGLILWAVLASRRKKLAAAAAQDYEDATLIELMGQEEDYEPIQLPESQEQKLKTQIKDLADSDPEIVAQLIKTWLLSA